MRLVTIIHAEHDRFVLWLPVLLGVGIGIYFALPFEPQIRALAGICALLALTTKFFWRRSIFARYLCVALLVVCVGAFRAEIRTQSVAAPILEKTLFFRELAGEISDIQIKEKGEKLILGNLQIDGLAPEETPVKASVSLREVTDGLNVGDRVSISAMLFPPPTPAMPQSYDFARSFYYEQLGAVGFSPKPPEILRKAQASGFEQELNALRLVLTQRILAPMSAENGWIAAAMMVGEQSGISKEVADTMREAGIYHIVSISGLHMSIAVMLMFVSARFLLSLYPPFALRFPVKKIAAIIGLVSAFAYLLLAGYPVPAVRSFIMVACVMLAILVDRNGISIFSLAWAGLLVLLWQPESLLGASFQLSFAATIAIVAFYERYSHILYKNEVGIAHKIWLYFLGIMLTSLVATLATTPLVIYHFNRFTLCGIAANMLMLPLASAWIMPCAVAAFLLMPFGAEYLPLLALDKGLSLMMVGARWIAEQPYASISLPPPTFWGILLCVFGGLWLTIWQKNWRLLGIPAAIIGMATIALHTPYDLLVSDDGTKVALRIEGDGKFMFIRGKETSFDGEMWLRSHGQETALTSKDMDEKLGICDKQKCTLTAYGKKIMVAKGNKEIEGICDGAPDIVISSSYLDRKAECARVPLLLDKAALINNGATGLRFVGDKTQIETSAQFRGVRPWVVK